MKRTFLLLLAILAVGSLAAQMQSATLRIFFPTGKFDLNAANKLRLDSLADSLAHHQRYEIALRGHTDSQGDSLANLVLSEKRSTSVNAYLTGRGIRIRDVRNLGQREPLLAAKTPEAMARNRRVDILVRYWRQPKVEPKPEIAEIVDTTTIDDLLKKLRKPDQVFCINPIRDTILVCADGAVLHFKAGCFKQSATCPDACVTIRVREVYNKSEQILDHLNTMSNRQLLESSGMIYTRAEDCNGKPIGLQPGQEMLAFIPAKEELTSEQLFYGHRQGADSVMNWHGAMPVRTVSQTGLKDIWCPNSFEGDGNRCPFFWCKIRLFFQKLFGIKKKKIKEGNRDISGCNKLQALCEKYKIQNPQALREGLYAQFVKKMGYKTLEEMFEKADPAKLDSIVANFHDEEMQNPELRYNYFTSPALGWNNIDRYMKYPPNMVTNVIVDQMPDKHTRCQIIFKKDHVLAEGVVIGDRYEFAFLPKEELATLLVMRYFNDKAYLAMQEIKIAPGPYKLELKEVSLKELDEALIKLNK